MNQDKAFGALGLVAGVLLCIFSDHAELRDLGMLVAILSAFLVTE